jgi:hypothetical protein
LKLLSHSLCSFPALGQNAVDSALDLFVDGFNWRSTLHWCLMGCLWRNLVLHILLGRALCFTDGLQPGSWGFTLVAVGRWHPSFLSAKMKHKHSATTCTLGVLPVLRIFKFCCQSLSTTPNGVKACEQLRVLRVLQKPYLI